MKKKSMLLRRIAAFLLALLLVWTEFAAGGLKVRAEEPEGTEEADGGTGEVNPEGKPTMIYVKTSKGDVNLVDKTTVEDGDGKLQYNASTCTLTMTDFKITRLYKHSQSEYYGLFCNGKLNIVVNGDCSIGGTAPSDATVIDGINVQQSLSIKNSSSSLTSSLTVSVSGTSKGTSSAIYSGYGLTIDGLLPVYATAASSVQDSYGVRAMRGLTLTGSATLRATGGSVTNKGRSSYGILSNGNVSIKGGTLKATGGSVKDSTARSYGMYVAGELNVSGGTSTLETASVSGDYFTENYALYVTTATTISGGKLSAKAGSASGSARSHGVFSGGKLSVTGGTLEAESGSAAGDDSVAVDAGTFAMSGGTLSATAGKATKESYGLRIADKDTRETMITGGTITAKGGSAKTSYGIKVNTYLTLTGGKCTASGNTESISAAKPKSGTDEVTIKAPVFWCGSSAGNAVVKKDYVYGSKYAVLDATTAVVLINDWTWGDTPNSPSVMNLDRYGNGKVSAGFAYKKSSEEDSAYGATVPSDAGNYVVRASLSNGLKATKSFKIKQRELSEVTATVTAGTYNGYSQQATIKLTYKDKELKNGTDYTIAEGAKATEVETLTAKISGKGNFTGTKSVKWSLNKAELSRDCFDLKTNLNYVYDGKGKSVDKPDLKGVYTGCGTITMLYDGKTELPVNTGSVSVTFNVSEGKNFKAASGLSYGTMVINKAANTMVVRDLTTVNKGKELDLNAAVQNAQGSVSFAIDGSALGCTLSGSVLKTGDTAGSIKIKATAAGNDNYKEAEISFTVNIRELKYADLSVTMPSITYGQTLADPSYTVPAGGWAETPEIRYTGRTAAGDEYNKTTKPSTAGSYVVSIEGMTTDTIYSGSASFTISPKEVKLVSVSAYGRAYNGDTYVQMDHGSAVLEGVIPADDGVMGCFVFGEFADPAAGKNKPVVITSVELYGGMEMLEQNYVLNDSAFPTNVTADIDPLPVKITAEDQIQEAGVPVVSSVDRVRMELISEYDVMPTGHVLSAITITGDTSVPGEGGKLTPSAAKISDADGNDMTANYAFTYAQGNLTVLARSLESAVVEVVPAEGGYVFNGSAIVPKDSEVTVTLDGTELAGGTDYTLSFSDNVHAGAATVKVNGKGGFSGQATGSFRIGPKTCTEPEIEVANAVWNGSALEPTVTVRDPETGLVDAMEYSLIYSNNVKVGDAAGVTIIDRDGGDYVISGSGTFSIKKGAMRTLDTISRYVSATDKTPSISIAAMLPADAGNATGYDFWEEPIENGLKLTDYRMDQATGEIILEIASGAVTDWAKISVWIKGENYDVNFWVQVIRSNLKNPEYTAPQAAVLSYTGEAQQLLIPGSVTKGGKMEYSEDMYEWSETIPVGTECGEYTVYYRITSTSEYNGVDATPIHVRIRNVVYKLTVVNGEGSGDYEAGESVVISASPAPSGQVFDSWTGEEDVIFADEGASVTTLIMPERATTVTATYKKDEKPQPVLKKAPVGKDDLKYNHIGQVLIEGGVAEGGTLLYALGSSASKAPKASDFSKALPKGEEAGYYYVWYYIKGDAEHGDSAPVCITVVIRQENGEVPDPPAPGPGDGDSPMDPVVTVDNLTTVLHLVKGQKFTIPKDMWSNSKKCDWKSSSPKVLTLSKKGVAVAKKASPDGGCVYLLNENSGKSIMVYISAPAFSGKKALELAAGESGSIGFDRGDAELPVFYASSALDVATVDQSGNVKAVAKGSAVITAYVNGKSYTRKVSVSEKSVALTRTLHVNKGATNKAIKVKGLKKANWEVESGTSVSIGKKNKLTAEAVGVSVIKATVDGTDYRITVIVEDPVITAADITAAKGKNKYDAKLGIGYEKKITFRGLSFDDPERQVVFKSSKPAVAFVDCDGTLKVRSKGKAKLTAKVNGTTITINVKAD
ncbi:MAG: Ig-like domain-containing protein [Lachnospiraceae bacterium]|nr:Ig-like domain-containing protein [Lachnospiraceae bacterium]